MGVNLKIKRLIFTSLSRRTSEGTNQTIESHEIRQIAGRAGRYMEDGKVAYLMKNHESLIRKALADRKENVIKKVKENEETEGFEELSDNEEGVSENLLNREY